MTDNNIALRTTTISLDEYNRLQNEATSLREQVGAKSQVINNLQVEISKLSEKQPVVRVTTGRVHHYHDEYDGNSSESYELDKTEFINLSEVETLAKKSADKELKEKIEKLETDLKSKEYLLKVSRNNVDTVQDKLDVKDKQIAKLRIANAEAEKDLTESYNKNVKLLEKAANEDSASYKETIKGLKEDIQKIKSDKTDKQIEEKRNQEIKDLKLRIKDLEGTIADLGKLNFFSRMFKLREISAEKLAAQIELNRRENAANKVGTTYVKEEGKYRIYNKFSEMLNQIFSNPNNNFYRTNPNMW